MSGTGKAGSGCAVDAGAHLGVLVGPSVVCVKGPLLSKAYLVNCCTTGGTNPSCSIILTVTASSLRAFAVSTIPAGGESTIFGKCAWAPPPETMTQQIMADVMPGLESFKASTRRRLPLSKRVLGLTMVLDGFFDSNVPPRRS